jgi:sugar/nucleoside kinase (ribokinase family)
MLSTRIAVVGDNTLDRFVDEPLGDLVGGNALNVAVQLAMFGHHVSYFGAVGDDADGALVREAGHVRRVDMTGTVIGRGSTALTRIRRTPAGDRVFESEEFGVTAEYHPDAAARECIARHDWVHIGMLPGADTLRHQLRELRPDVRISQDCSVSEGWSHLRVAFMSAGEDPHAAATMTKAALAGGAKLAVATLGSKGVFARDSSHIWRREADPVEVVDTTGAGDAFMAGFVSSYIEHGDVADALRAGSARGAFACSFHGGWPQLPADQEKYG